MKQRERNQGIGNRGLGKQELKEQDQEKRKNMLGLIGKFEIRKKDEENGCQ